MGLQNPDSPVQIRVSPPMLRFDLARSRYGSIAQLGEHLPYKQRVIGSSPIVPTIFGPVVQLVRTLACHARGRRFEPVPGRHLFFIAALCRTSADVAHLVERHLAKVEVASSSLVIRSTKHSTLRFGAFNLSPLREFCGNLIIWGYSSAGRALEWHSRGQRFDPAYLHQKLDRLSVCQAFFIIEFNISVICFWLYASKGFL